MPATVPAHARTAVRSEISPTAAQARMPVRTATAVAIRKVTECSGGERERSPAGPSRQSRCPSGRRAARGRSLLAGPRPPASRRARHAGRPNAHRPQPLSGRGAARPRAVGDGGDDPAGDLGRLEHDTAAGARAARRPSPIASSASRSAASRSQREIDDDPNRVVGSHLRLADHEVAGVGARVPVHAAAAVAVLVGANAPQVSGERRARGPVALLERDASSAASRAVLARLRRDMQRTGELEDLIRDHQSRPKGPRWRTGP